MAENGSSASSVFSSAMLIAGTTVGAGILAVPLVTQPAGFIASTVALAGTCLFSIVTGLLIAEVALNLRACQDSERDADGLSLLSMARSTLGSTGAGAMTVVYLFQHYTLLVAYISKGGEILGGATHLPSPAGSVAFAAAVGLGCALLPPRVLDGVNNIMVAGVVGTFLGLVALVLPNVDWGVLLSTPVWREVPHALPVIALAFVYQNVVPVVVKDLRGDVGKVRTAIVGGSLLPLAMFVVWEAVVLGSMGAASGSAAAAANSVADPLTMLAKSDPLVGPLVDGFSLFAIATSFVGFCLGLSDFLVDLLGGGTQQSPQAAEAVTSTSAGADAAAQPLSGDAAGGRRGAGAPGLRSAAYALTVIPPLGLALSFPDIFLQALDIAGTYGVMTLFGILPAAMAWLQRSALAKEQEDATLSEPLLAGHAMARGVITVVPGGVAVLLLVAGLSTGIIANEVVLRVVKGL